MAMNMEAVLRIAAKVTGLENVTKLEKSIGAAEKIAKDARASFSAVVSSATWQTAAVAATAIGAGLASSVKVAMDFERAMSGVQAKVGGTSEEIAQLTDLARDLGRRTQFSATQAAAGMDFLAMAGFRANDIIAAMPGLLDLAAAGNLELGAAADIASNILGGLSLEAEETGRVADVLAKAATSSNVSVEMLGETFKFVAPVAAQAGVSLEELAAATGLLGDAGIQGSEAGTGLRSVLLRLAAPPIEAAKALDRLSVATKDNAGNMRPFGDILRDVDRRMAELNIGTAEQLEIQDALYGKTAIASGAILQQAAANGQLDQKTRQLMQSQGAASEMAETMNDNVAGAFKRLMSAIEGFQIALTTGANPALGKLIDGLAGAINVVTDLMERFPVLTSIVLALSAAFVALVAAAPFIAAFISVIGSLKAVIVGASLGATVAGWAGAIIPAIAAIKAAFLGLVGWLAGTLLPGLLAFFSGPVGWTVLAVAAVVAMAIAFRKPLMDFISWLWNWGKPIRQFWVDLWNGVVSAVSYSLGAVGNALRAWGGEIVKIWTGDFSTLEAIVNGWRDAVVGVWSMMSSAFVTYVASPIATAWQALVGSMSQAMSSVADFVQGIWSGMVEGVKGAVRGMLQFIANRINSVAGLINNLIRGFNNLPGVSVPLIPTVQVPAFAAGGTVNRPTLAMVGEGGEREYIIPESKMAAASSRFLSGQRGASVIPSSGGSSGSGATPQINIRTGPVMQQSDGSRWVSMDDLERGMQQLATQLFEDLRRPDTRAALGVL